MIIVTVNGTSLLGCSLHLPTNTTAATNNMGQGGGGWLAELRTWVAEEKTRRAASAVGECAVCAVCGMDLPVPHTPVPHTPVPHTPEANLIINDPGANTIIIDPDAKCMITDTSINDSIETRPVFPQTSPILPQTSPVFARHTPVAISIVNDTSINDTRSTAFGVCAVCAVTCGAVGRLSGAEVGGGGGGADRMGLLTPLAKKGLSGRQVGWQKTRGGAGGGSKIMIIEP